MDQHENPYKRRQRKHTTHTPTRNKKRTADQLVKSRLASLSKREHRQHHQQASLFNKQRKQHSTRSNKRYTLLPEQSTPRIPTAPPPKNEYSCDQPNMPPGLLEPLKPREYDTYTHLSSRDGDVNERRLLRVWQSPGQVEAPTQGHGSPTSTPRVSVNQPLALARKAQKPVARFEVAEKRVELRLSAGPAGDAHELRRLPRAA